MPETKPKVTLRIERGSVSPAQKQAWKRFWQKLMSEYKREVTGERENH
jgi:hypothetical protein